MLASAQVTPYALPGWRLAEMKAVKALALTAVGRASEADNLMAGTAAALQSYNQPDIQQYLLNLLKAQGSKR